MRGHSVFTIHDHRQRFTVVGLVKWRLAADEHVQYDSEAPHICKQTMQLIAPTKHVKLQLALDCVINYPQHPIFTILPTDHLRCRYTRRSIKLQADATQILLIIAHNYTAPYHKIACRPEQVAYFGSTLYDAPNAHEIMFLSVEPLVDGARIIRHHSYTASQHLFLYNVNVWGIKYYGDVNFHII